MDPNEEDIENAVDDPEQVSLSQAVVPVVLKDSDTLLVETVSAYPTLYDKSLKEYHMSEIRQNCWEMVAAITNTSVAHCQKRWTQLRDSFTSEKRRRNNEQKSGSGATKRKGFALYDEMEFLHKHVVQKKTFTNISPPSVATSSVACLQQSNVHLSSQLGPVHRFPGSTPTITLPDDMPVSDMPGETNFPIQLDLLSSFPLTPESNSSTPPPIPNMPTPSPEPGTTTSTLLPSTYSLLPRVRTPNSETLAVSPKAASSNHQEGSSAFNKVTCTKTSVESRSCNSNMLTLSSPPPSPRTPTPHRKLQSPVSPYSSCSDMSYTFSPEDISQTATSGSTAPTSCYTKDLRKCKKVDPIERSFLGLSSVMQDHFSQKLVKQPEVNNSTNSNTEHAFGSLIATELQKLDDQTKKQKKARIIQILYE